MRKIGIITGLKSEADCLGPYLDPSKFEIQISGASSERAFTLCNAMARSGAELLISFGVAGALGADLNPGDLILPETIIAGPGTEFTVDAGIRNKLLSQIPKSLTAMKISSGSIYGSDALITSPEEKRALHSRFGSLGTDMESHKMALAAADNGLPFLVIRSVLDELEATLPKSVHGAIKPDGTPDYARIIANFCAHPSEIASLAGLALRSRKALSSLRGIAPLLEAL
ncbi:MAG: hypothetical protein HQ503_06750 [Rhodospirillales bacterium]|nr:hypothetical protein [Rhodospirillales bacterium]